MRFTTRRDALLETLAKVKLAVPPHCTLPVLANVLLRVEKGQVQLIATDLEQALVGSVRAGGSGKSAIAISPKSLEQFLKAVDAPNLTCTISTKVKRWTQEVSHYNSETQKPEESEEPRESRTVALLIEAGAASTTIPGLDPKDYPSIPKIPDMPLKFSDLQDAIGEVRYAVAKEENRPALAGISFTQKGTKAELAAADGFRLAITSCRMRGQFGERAIITSRAADMVRRLFTGTITAGRFKGTSIEGIAFRQNGLVLFSNFIASTYPQYEQLVPKRGKKIQVSTATLAKALKVAASISSKNPWVKLVTRGHNLLVSHKNDEGQETVVKMPARGKVNISFDLHYLQELVAHCGEEFTLQTTDAKSPGVVRNNGTIHVVMPRITP